MTSKFRKSLALIAKFVLLAITVGILGNMAYLAYLANEGLMGTVLAVLAVGAILIYSTPRFTASKFFYPGIIFLLLFVITPVIYTAVMSTYNYKDGNLITKDQALTQLIDVTGIVPDESGVSYEYIPGRCKGELAMLLKNIDTEEVSLACDSRVTPLAEGQYTIDEFGVPTGAEGFTAFVGDEQFAYDEEIANLKFKIEDPAADNRYIRADGAGMAFDAIQTLTYDAEKDELYNTVNGLTYVNNGNGNFVNPNNPDEKIFPGWRQLNPAQNYAKILTDPVLRDPFIRVFIWTIVFAFTTVVMMGFVGLLVAVALDKRIRFRNIYRGLLILPYAMPSFMSILIWAGMFNRDYGAINTLFGTDLDFLNNPWSARAMLLIVNLWLGFPYFYMISTGALQALPTDLEEAAALDGATEKQIFFRIKMPLVLQILSPLLIASVAFNFNNFNLVYLLTRGGPTNVLDGETAGATDILITYAYKTAFAGAEQNLGLASAISVIVFIIVGIVSLWSLKRSKVLEEVR
jgi:arabinogalactan oligomer/maltooligosaccharide transport system permease protein